MCTVCVLYKSEDAAVFLESLIDIAQEIDSHPVGKLTANTCDNSSHVALKDNLLCNVNYTTLSFEHAPSKNQVWI